ncbi:beta-ketoacyl-[acyl-carrier-protein] synthase family protein [Acetobacter sp. LMG 32666]|uniref:beta-ketoacyl-[acyl-carrier-protein] synthase family protein n=1 Tax=Acetobacter sp. LMG 32666 TaxID=2959295 RepID=UPI0030C8A76E
MKPLAITAGTVLSAIGQGLAETQDALLDRRSGLTPCDFAGITTGYVGRVPLVENHALEGVHPGFACRNNQLADMAFAQADFLHAVGEARQFYGPDRVAVVLGTSTSGILSAEEAYRASDPVTGFPPATFDQSHTQDLFSLPRFVAARLGLDGPLLSVSNACASSSRAFVDARHWLEAGLCDAVLVGGADSLCRMTLRGFASLGLVSHTPTCPCDAERTGISVGEGAGFALLEREGARPGAAPMARWVGYGVSSDGHHMSSPDPRARGAVAAMREALERAGLEAAQIDYINLHGTGTVVNDAMEDHAVHTLFGNAVPCSSTKGWTGHTLGASGIIEAMFAIVMMRAGFVPGCLNVTQPDPAFESQILTNTLHKPVRRIMSNAFGFGGTNCSLIFEAV